MTSDKNAVPKRAYSAPKLTVYGDMATLTKGGVGSIVENMESNSNHRP